MAKAQQQATCMRVRAAASRSWPLGVAATVAPPAAGGGGPGALATASRRPESGSTPPLQVAEPDSEIPKSSFRVLSSSWPPASAVKMLAGTSVPSAFSSSQP